MNKTIKLPCYGIQIELEGCDESLSGILTSNLHHEVSEETEITYEEEENSIRGAINAVESFILACACAGVDVESLAFVQAIETTVDGIINNYV